jgi:hypothetical protein
VGGARAGGRGGAGGGTGGSGRGSGGSGGRGPGGRGSGGPRGPSGGGRARAGAGASDRAAIQQRRLVLAVGAVIFVILAAVGINSCESSALTNSLKSYANSVQSLMQQSHATGNQLFHDLENRTLLSSSVNLKNSLDTLVSGPGGADAELSTAQGLSVPDQMHTAESYLVLVLKMRRDGIRTIASEIEQALGNATNIDALQAIAGAMANFYGSDAIYKNYVTKELAKQLHADSIGIGGTSGETIDAEQFLPSLDWLDVQNLSQAIGAHYTKPGNPNLPITPGTHGHLLNSVTVGGTTLSTTASNAVPTSSVPTFVLNFTNSGANKEFDVKCKVTVDGTSIQKTVTVPETTPGETTSCNVQLKPPSSGQYQVTAQIEKVPGEKVISNNSMTFPITFQ